MVNAVEVVNDVDHKSIDLLGISHDRPILFKGLVANWPAVKEARKSLQAFAAYTENFYAGQPVVLYSAEKGGRYFYGDDYKSLNFESSVSTLSDFFSCLHDPRKNTASSFYIGSTSLDECLPGFRKANDIELNSLEPMISIWLGNESKVAAHFDAPDNLACCIAGKRTFTLFPTDQIANLYPGPLELTPSGQIISTVNFSSPDFAMHPKFEQALENALIAELEPGDALYIPSMWWHHVESHASFNGLINYWWRDVPQYLDPPIDLIYHAILTLRDLPEREKQAWKSVLDYFIFDKQTDKHAHLPEDARGSLAPLTDRSARKIRALLLNKLNC